MVERGEDMAENAVKIQMKDLHGRWHDVPAEAREGFSLAVQTLRFMQAMDTDWTGIVFEMTGNLPRTVLCRVFTGEEKIVDVRSKFGLTI
jgi:hypothetical protein